MLGSRGISLDKWAANHRALYPIRSILEEGEEPKAIEDGKEVKALGVYWHPRHDAFLFKACDWEVQWEATTRRRILSNLSALFDPLTLAVDRDDKDHLPGRVPH